ncbi:polymeric immunoglobulin receptor-like isoform X1 [Struthio camelus]|uniref:polymeric immunoglobulin receptor-like isoform X1 n=2 Tax=Struthio camelus TaxID=8801 RepID=UPI003603C59E
MELRVLLLLPLCCPGLQAQTPLPEESRREGSTLTVLCPYTIQTGSPSQKVWCRLRNRLCEPLVETTYSMFYEYQNQATEGTVTIEDDIERGTISITMRNLQVQDSGKYSCGSHLNTDKFFPLKTISLNVFKEFHSQELDTLSVQCPYSAQTYSTTTKAWCRREGHTLCKTMVSTNYPSTRHYSKAQQNRTSIQDDTWDKTVTITMQKLQEQDTGVYWCTRNTYTGPIRIMEVRLTVSKRTQQYTARESDMLHVQCLYSSPDYRAVTKAWCKVGAGKECAVLVRTDQQPSEHHRTAQPGTTTIQDDSRRGIITVTMEKLQAQDSGVYWCALYEHPQLFRIVEVTLDISNGSDETTLSVTANTSQTTPSVNNASFTTTAPPKRSSVNIFILLSVFLGILLILALTSVITLCIKKHRQPRQGNRQAEDIYDKPEDTAQFQSTERMESPENDSKDLKYVTLNFINQLSPEEPLYANVGQSQAAEKPKAETVEYANIALKQLPANNKG